MLPRLHPCDAGNTPSCSLQHMGVELDEQNRRVDAVGARAENTHDEIRSVCSHRMATLANKLLSCVCMRRVLCLACCDVVVVVVVAGALQPESSLVMLSAVDDCRAGTSSGMRARTSSCVCGSQPRCLRTWR